ncbi:MAG: hypothetical protein AAF583_05465 [Pseudomonadota bacterium]
MTGDHSITDGVYGDGKAVFGTWAFRCPLRTAEPVSQRFCAMHGLCEGAQATSCLIGRVGTGKLDSQRSNGKCRFN